MRYVLVFLILAIVIASGCVSQQEIKQETHQITIIASNNQTVVDIEIADEIEERRQGLMHREYLAEDHGMLFVYPEERQLSFWMKNTLIPLDILFISGNLTIIDIQTMQPCKTVQCPSYKSSKSAMYALEVNAGFAEKHKIKIGDMVELVAKAQEPNGF